MKNKKGQIGDMFFVILTITSIALTMLMAGFIYKEMQTGINDPDLASNESISAYNAFEAAFPMIDMGMLFIVLALVIGLLVSSLFIPSSPIFLVINIIGMLVLIYIGATFSNLYGVMLDQPGANTTFAAVSASYYPITTFVMRYLPYIGLIIVLFSTIVMYSKSRSEF